MPTYVYKCSECNQTFEYIQKMSEEKKTDCPDCEITNTLVKQISSTGFL